MGTGTDRARRMYNSSQYEREDRGIPSIITLGILLPPNMLGDASQVLSVDPLDHTHTETSLILSLKANNITIFLFTIGP